MAPTTYAEFLRLPQLLGSVAPRTPPDDRRVHTAEHFFLVAHQTSELWLKQVLLDVGEGTEAARERDLDQAAAHVDRAAAVLRLIASHAAVFRQLSPRDFAQFRPGFGDASGAQSGQFHRLQRELGLHDHPSALCAELLAAVREQGTTLVRLYQQAPHGGGLFRLAEAMADLSQAAWHWQLDHLETVIRVIGRVPGTGGTSGANYLSDRMAAPFPELWEARSLVHRSNGGTQCQHETSQR